MSKIPTTAHPNIIILPSVYCIILILLTFAFRTEFIQTYLISFVVAFPLVLFQKKHMKDNFNDYVNLVAGSESEKKAIKNKFAKQLLIWGGVLIADILTKFPFLYSSLAFSIILVPDYVQQYKAIAEKATGSKVDAAKLKKEIVLGNIVLIVVIFIWGYLKQ